MNFNESFASFSLVTIAIAVEAFFARSETAFLSANRGDIFRRARENFSPAAVAKLLLNRPERLFSTTILGASVGMNTASAIATIFIIQNFGYEREWLSLVLITPLVLIFGEIIPKTLGRLQAERTVYQVARPLFWLTVVLAPITGALVGLTRLLGFTSRETHGRSFYLSREELKATLPAMRGTDVTSSERELVERILEFGKITAKEMLRPLIDVVAIEEKDPIRDALKMIAETNHSRIAVFRERIDCIVGFVSGFDCLKAAITSDPVEKIMHPVLFIPESKPLDELLLELRSSQMAVAVNEFGGAEGIITMEDVIEEVVGDIEDEYDDTPRLFHKIGESSFIVNARIEIDQLEEIIGASLPREDEYQTLAGFLLSRMQKIPKKWDSVTVGDVEYVIQSATDRTIEEVYILVRRRPL